MVTLGFEGTSLSPRAEAMGDYAGHADEGQRLKKQVTVEGGAAKIAGDTAGNTSGIGVGPAQRFGRWEARTRLSANATDYHGVLLLWPTSGGGGVSPANGGEVDFSEAIDPSRATVNGFLHVTGADQIGGEVKTDANQWHNWAVEWTATKLTYYLDGRQWFSVDITANQLPGQMDMTAQLDYFPGD
ncbi:MAG: glycoside hydrolase family 16 protein, partial [Pseudonocardiaceae bacterium]